MTLTVLVLLGLTTLGAYSSHAQTAHDAYGEARRDWVDAAVPAGAKVTVLWDQRRAPVDAQGRALDGGLSGLYYRLMLTELFNPSIETLHRFGGTTIYENHLPSIPVRRGAGGVVVGPDGRPVERGTCSRRATWRCGDAAWRNRTGVSSDSGGRSGGSSLVPALRARTNSQERSLGEPSRPAVRLAWRGPMPTRRGSSMYRDKSWSRDLPFTEPCSDDRAYPRRAPARTSAACRGQLRPT